MPSAAPIAIRRVYVEKRPGFDIEARRLREELAEFLGEGFPGLRTLAGFRILHRYDVSGLSAAEFALATRLVFSEPQCDAVFPVDLLPLEKGETAFAIEYLPGQYDQRADSAEQCAELATGVRPRVRTARVFVLAAGKGTESGAKSDGAHLDSESLDNGSLGAVKQYLINPVDSREAPLGLPDTLDPPIADPAGVPILNGFRVAGDLVLAELARSYGLAMAIGDLRFCRDYFKSEGRDPTLAELRVLDTYWSDHCRHSTFTTVLEKIELAGGEDLEGLTLALSLYEKARVELYGAAGAAERPRTLMDMATIGGKLLRSRGQAEDLEVSAEINACSVRVRAEFADGSDECWLLMFKNETHNHPTEIEPFGGSATCLGGAIRDPLSGRAYVHQAMRVTGGGDPRVPLSHTLPGKLPQVKIAREASAGYSSYGNQIGLATGQVSEFYHPGFVAKRMELGAVIGAVPEAWVRREEPREGDIVLLVGGKTGRDGIGGATGSSKAHTDESVRTAGAEVQKGNAVEERKIQRLFRKPEVTRLIKRCNDFGAGGVSVAVGELAPGLDIDLNAIPKKYEGLDGIELAISESQERMAVVVAPEDAAAFIAFAAAENLHAVTVARVTVGTEDNGPRLRMKWRGTTIVDLDRAFLDSNGASRSANALVFTGSVPGVAKEATTAVSNATKQKAAASPVEVLRQLEAELASLRTASRRGLQERFDGSIGAASVLFPWGGKVQGTPECGMAALLPSLDKESRTASLMTFGYDPELASLSPYRGAKAAILEALAKFACLGGDPFSARLSLQEYFERMDCPEAWGKPAAALLGALEAQIALGVPAIGGKDSMSGTYRDPSGGRELKVPPTLVAFAAGVAPAAKVRSGALTGTAGNLILLFASADEWTTFRANVNALESLERQGLVRSAYPVVAGGIAASVALMAFGNLSGVEVELATLAGTTGQKVSPGSFLVEVDGTAFASCGVKSSELLSKAAWAIIGRLIPESVFRVRDQGATTPSSAEIPLAALRRVYEAPLSRVYPQTASGLTVADIEASQGVDAEAGSNAHSGIARGHADWTAGPIKSFRIGRSEAAKPLVVLPAFPGTNCEWDMERAFRRAGARTEVLVFRNRTHEDVGVSTAELAKAIAGAQIVALSGGFSAGDEPDGSGKFIANAFRSPAVEKAVTGLLDTRDGLVLGICNGFQALIKLGLVPFGEYRDADASLPTLTFNSIGRHVSRIVRTRVTSNLSPWLALDPVGSIHSVPVSHGEGRIAISDTLSAELFGTGRVAFRYADALGLPTMAEADNPNGSVWAIEGLSSPDGRVLGKMAHSERVGESVLKNIPGDKEQKIFEAGVRYFG